MPRMTQNFWLDQNYHKKHLFWKSRAHDHRDQWQDASLQSLLWYANANAQHRFELRRLGKQDPVTAPRVTDCVQICCDCVITQVCDSQHHTFHVIMMIRVLTVISVFSSQMVLLTTTSSYTASRPCAFLVPSLTTQSRWLPARTHVKFWWLSDSFNLR